MTGVSMILQSIVGHLGVLYAVLFTISLYAAYELNRRLYFIKRSLHPHTYKLFNQLRFLFLFLGIYFVTHLIQNFMGEKVDIVCLILAILRIASYIGIGTTVMNIALSPVLTLGRPRDNSPENE
jgi:surface polysaccharide O-acyltransferase-like enzyme